MIELSKGNGLTNRFSGRCNFMNENELKSYDIASFDIEMEYNKQTAPITKKIDKLNSSHETKSLRAHKDFLKKEKKSKEKLNELSDKAIIKDQKIEKAADNKAVKQRTKEKRIKKEFDEFVVDKKLLAKDEYAKIDEVTELLKQEEIADKEEIKMKYKTNIESYVEKLDIYNNNFEKNKQFHVEEIKKYQEIINQQTERLRQFNLSVTTELNEKLISFTEQKTTHDTDIKNTKSNTSRALSSYATSIHKSSNVKITDIHDYIEKLKKDYEIHLNPEIVILEAELKDLTSKFEERRILIQDDLELNIIKLEQQLEAIKESKNRKANKNINMKIDLFNIRATTTIKYEERILNEKLVILQNEIELIKQQLDYELLNLDKLEVFLLNDQNELKETGDYFKELNLVLKTELNNFELSNNSYLLKHEQLKTDFINNYTKIFSDLKENTIALSQSYLEKIADNNFEIDDINKFLDTAEPLKEIEVNRLREDIEISEVTERFNIKYAKQAYESDLIKNDLNIEISIAEQEMKELLSDTAKENTMIKTKEAYDKALEKAKLKHSKAQEVYNLRLNNTKLERNLLKNKYDTELSISTHKKELIEIDVRKHNALLSKEIEYSIKNLETEASYKIEVINKGLEEELLKLDENVSKITFEKDAYSSNLNIEIDQKVSEAKQAREAIEQKSLEKINLIEQALEREIRVPARNILKTETIIDERLSRLDVNNGIFVDFITNSIEDYKDNKLTLEQIREVIINNDSVYDKAIKYINRTYSVLNEAIKFMNDIEKHAVLNKIAAASDQSSIRRLKKQQSKTETEIKKQKIQISTSEKDHIVLIKTYIDEEIRQIKKGNFDELNDFVNAIEVSYNKVFTHMSNLQNNIKKETSELYSALTKNDQEVIDHANLNAEKANKLEVKEKAETLSPINQALDQFISDKEAQRTAFNETLENDIKELKAQINHLKNDALDKVKEINLEKNDLTNTKKEQKRTLEETEEKEITIRYEDIGTSLETLAFNYNQTLAKVDEKDTEAKKIFDYEDRIYNIAVESATSRFNDANIKTNNRHLNNVKLNRNNIEKAKKDKDLNINTLNKDLLNLTNKFEKNIFTVRPRLEESIGDAQKAIDKETQEKELKLNELTDNNNKLILAAETSLFTVFHEGYDRLNHNLSSYIEKYRVIEEEYIQINNKSNDVLNANNITFSNALFELNKDKHERTLQNLLDINTQILSEEDNNG